jgi:hypothetical protein
MGLVPIHYSFVSIRGQVFESMTANRIVGVFLFSLSTQENVLGTIASTATCSHLRALYRRLYTPLCFYKVELSKDTREDGQGSKFRNWSFVQITSCLECPWQPIFQSIHAQYASWSHDWERDSSCCCIGCMANTCSLE